MPMDPEFESRYSGRYYGKYRAVVFDVQDPRKLGRLLVKVPSLFGMDEVLGWAWPLPAAGGDTDVGDVAPVSVGTLVMVEFEEGDPSQSYWRPAPWGLKNGENMFMRHSRGESDTMDYATRDFGNIPPSQFAGKYQNVRMMRSKDGSFLEFDSTPGEERTQLAHYTGSRMEMTADGGMQLVANAAFRQRAEGMRDVEVNSNDYLVIGGERAMRVTGNLTEEVTGLTTQRYKSVDISGRQKTQSWEGKYDLLAGGTLGIKTTGNSSLRSGGQFSIMSGQNMVGTVMEMLEMSVSCATTGQVGLGGPTAVGTDFHTFNGISQFYSTDVTGLATECGLIADPLPGAHKAALYATTAQVPMGKVEVNGLPLVNTLLGGPLPPTDAVICGTSFMASFVPMMAAMHAFITAMQADPLLKAVAPVTSAGAATFLIPLTAFNVAMGAQLSWLSTSVMVSK